MVSPGSHRSTQLSTLRNTYGLTGGSYNHTVYSTLAVGPDGTASGWLTEDPNQLEEEYGELSWMTTDYKMGDVVILGLDLLHMSTTNTTDRYYFYSFPDNKEIQDLL
jgi:hypothetical protein